MKREGGCHAPTVTKVPWLIKCWDHVHHQWFEINRIEIAFLIKKRTGLLLCALDCLAADGVALLTYKDVVAVMNISMLCFPCLSSSCCHFNLGMSKLCFVLAHPTSVEECGDVVFGLTLMPPPGVKQIASVSYHSFETR